MSRSRNLEHLGGRCLEDGQQYWWSLGSFIREQYEMNQVPKGIAARYTALECEISELLVRQLAFIELVQKEVGDE